MTGARLVWHQFRYDQRTFRRDPAAVFFTVALPIVFLLVFVTIFGNEEVEIEGGVTIKGSTYYVPGLITLGLVTATFVNLSISLTGAREETPALLKTLVTGPCRRIADSEKWSTSLRTVTSTA